MSGKKGARGVQSYQTLVQALTRDDPPKTWSLIVTVLGDLDAPAISGKDLGALLKSVDIKPEAVRVALHRLKQDGWITSQKTGRQVSYALSDHGRAETFAAQHDVYRRDVKFPDGWRVFAVPAEVEPHDSIVQLAKGLVAVPAAVAVRPNRGFEMRAVDPSLPPWMSDHLLPPRLLAQAGQMAQLAESLTGADLALSPREKVAARLLLLHYWRRMALRPATWAHIGLSPQGQVARCHRGVTQLLAATDAISVNVLHENY